MTSGTIPGEPPPDTAPRSHATSHRAGTSRARRIVVVGSGTRFLSGITVYTVRLAEALADAGVRASVVTMRQLLPTFLYPGKARVGTDLTELGDRGKVPTFDGIDWWWLPSLALAARFLRRQRPDTIVLQWWTGTVFHSYLALSLLARALGARVVIEFHEVQDTGEIRSAAGRSLLADGGRHGHPSRGRLHRPLRVRP